MKPLLLLIVVFAATSAISKFVTSSWNLPLSANLAMCLMLCFTALGHFMFPKGMAMMIPSFIPYRTPLVYITGIAEILLGLALLSPALRSYAGYVLIVFFILMLPANIYAAIKHIDLEKGTYGGPGLNYLWFRIPMQLFLIAWVYYFSISSSI